MRSDPLDLQLSATLAEAQTDPESIDLLVLWHELEPFLSDLPCSEQLRLAGTVLSQLAELYWAKATQILDDWEEGHNDQGPVPTDLLLDGIRVRQTRQVDVSDLVRQPTRSKRESQPKPQENSVVEPVAKTKVLRMLDHMEEAQQALAVAHDEDITAWQNAIAHYLRQQNASEVQLLQLQQDLQMPLVKLWLGLLLGEYRLEQRGEFYDSQGVWLHW